MLRGSSQLLSLIATTTLRRRMESIQEMANFSAPPLLLFSLFFILFLIKNVSLIGMIQVNMFIVEILEYTRY